MLRTLVLSFALPAALFGLQGCSDASQATNSSTGPPEKPPVPVEVFVVKTDTLREALDLTGTLLPEERLEVMAEVQGRVSQINFREGQLVSKGQLLIALDDSELQAERSRLKVELQLAETRLGRQKALLEAEALSQDEYDQTEAAVARIRAEKELLEARLAKTRIYAPFAGKMGLRVVSLGAVVGPGTVLTTLQQLDPIRLSFRLPERYRSLVTEGSAINFRLEGEQSLRTAKVFLIEPQVDADSRTVQVLAHIANPNRQLLPGTYASVSLNLQFSDKAIMLPAIAVISELKGQYVFLAKNGKAIKHPVRTGYRAPQQIEILEGLSVGDSVLRTGILLVQNEGRISIVK